MNSVYNPFLIHDTCCICLCFSDATVLGEWLQSCQVIMVGRHVFQVTTQAPPDAGQLRHSGRKSATFERDRLYRAVASRLSNL